jgi:hypothetical protein
MELRSIRGKEGTHSSGPAGRGNGASGARGLSESVPEHHENYPER